MAYIFFRRSQYPNKLPESEFAEFENSQNKTCKQNEFEVSVFRRKTETSN